MNYKSYHKYVFDNKNKKFVGDFESMYKNESKSGYDSWNQEDLRDLGYQFSLSIINQYNFESILDIGCGKGLFTSLLKKKNNRVFGIDISKTAIKRAHSTYPDIVFLLMDVNKWCNIPRPFELVIIKEVLSYIKNWKELIHFIPNVSEYLFISLDLPKDPIGFIKNFSSLESVIKEEFNIITKVKINSDVTSNVGQCLYFCKRREE